MLDPLGRGAIIALTALCVAGVFAFAPIRGRSSTDDAQLQALPNVGAIGTGSITITPIRRDPFAAPAAPSRPAAAPALAVPPGAIGTLPSNLASDTIPAVPGDAADSRAAGSRVTAIITGAHPCAMVLTGAVHEIKVVGDRVAGSTIVSIDLAGIRLQNGDRLTVDAAGR